MKGLFRGDRSVYCPTIRSRSGESAGWRSWLCRAHRHRPNCRGIFASAELSKDRDRTICEADTRRARSGIIVSSLGLYGNPGLTDPSEELSTGPLALNGLRRLRYHSAPRGANDGRYQCKLGQLRFRPNSAIFEKPDISECITLALFEFTEVLI